MPLYAAAFMVFTLAIPDSGNVGIHRRVLTLLGTFPINRLAATLATLGVILSAAYSLWLYRKMMFGQLKPSLAGIMESRPPRNPRPGAAGDPDDLFRHLSQAGARHAAASVRRCWKTMKRRSVPAKSAALLVP